MRAVLAVGGGGRQWKHHPIYVQREERFQFCFFFSAHLPPLPHTQRASPRSFPFAAAASHSRRDLTARFGTRETHGLNSAKSSACGTLLWQLSRERKQKGGQLWTRPFLRNPRFSLRPCKQHAGVRQNCISCKYLLNFLITLFSKRPTWQFGSNSHRRLEDHPTSK